MSASKWAYSPDKCDGQPCVGDCDMCYKAEDKIEDDGFITREEDLKGNIAKPMTKCDYPKCEKCAKRDNGYCTVPMVISKQVFFDMYEKMEWLTDSLRELKKTVYDEILGE